LVSGSLLHIDSTIVKASASKDSVKSSSPEMVRALRQAYQQQQSKLEVLPQPPESEPAAQNQAAEPVSEPAPQPTATVVEGQTDARPQTTPARTPALRVVPPGAGASTESTSNSKPAGKKLPVNSTHISTTDPEARRRLHGFKAQGAIA
jgi:hypothetical protein